MTNVEHLREEYSKFPPYAWPGGYAIAYLMDDGEFLCAGCMNDNPDSIHFSGSGDGWRVDGFITADWHDTGDGDWICAHCYVIIDKGDED